MNSGSCRLMRDGEVWADKDWIAGQVEDWKKRIENTDRALAAFSAARLFDDPKYNLYLSAVIDTAHQLSPSPDEARKIVLAFAHHLPTWLNETTCWRRDARDTVPIGQVSSKALGSVRRLLRKIVRDIVNEQKRATG